VFTIALLIAGGTLAAPTPADEVKKAHNDLQGTWVAVAMEERGEKLATDDVKKEDISLIVKGNELTTHHGKDEPNRFSFTLDPTKKPAHLDLKELGDKARPGIIHAIYALENGELTICLGSRFNPDEEKERPQEFATGPSEKRPPKGKVMVRFKQSEK
jgi:uncharacterized protein (TIGR03067 family)